MKQIRSMLPQLFETIDVPFVDVANIASYPTAGVSLYTDYAHVSPIGSRKLAENMFPTLLSVVLKHTIEGPS